MIRRLRAPLRAVTAIALVVAVLPVGSAGAVAPEAQAWWYVLRNSQIPIETPVPPSVEDNGLYVAAGPNGAVAIAALRAPVGDATEAVVTLDLTDTTGDVVVGACLTAAWSPVQAGNWDERPETDCDGGSVSGVVSDDGASLTFDATSLLRNGVLDIALTPGVGADGSPANFTATIAPPDADTISAASTPAAPSTTAAPAAGAAPPVAASPTPPRSAPAASPPFRPAAGVETLPEPTSGIEIPPQVTETVSAAPTPRPRPVASSPVGDASDSGRALAIGLIVALAIAFALLRGRPGPVPAPILAIRVPAAGPTAGPIGGAAVGVGRFAKERAGRAPPLT